MKQNGSLVQQRNVSLLALAFLLLVGFFSCKDDNNGDDRPTYDPTKPLVCNEFLPDSGGVGTQLIIRGENFGSDPDLVKVFVNNKTATVIGVNDTRIYAVVPSRADTGQVKVLLGEGTGAQTYTFEKNFNYLFRQNVSTLCGHTDNDGNSKVVDGTLAEAWIKDPWYISVDSENELFVLEANLGLRRIDQNMDQVSTPFRVSGGIGNIRSSDFSPNEDTLYITNDRGSWNDIGIFTVTRGSGFMNPKEYLKSYQANGVAVNPIDGEVFFNSYSGGYLYRWDKVKQERVEVLTLGENSYSALAFTKDGKTLYIMSTNNQVIYSIQYDFSKKKLIPETQILVAGKKFERGCVDGIGSVARFDAGDCGGTTDDEGNLFYADVNNHVIRKITPDGVVTVYAGTPKQAGYLDGLPLKAKFNAPHHVSWGKNGVLYVADTKNHRIRRILIE